MINIFEDILNFDKVTLSNGVTLLTLGVYNFIKLYIYSVIKFNHTVYI